MSEEAILWNGKQRVVNSLLWHLAFSLYIVSFFSAFPVFAATEPTVDVTVIKGDTLKNICSTYLEDPRRCKDIFRLNRMKNPDIIYPGQKVAFPVSLLKGVPIDGTVSFVRNEVTFYGEAGAEEKHLSLHDTISEGGRIVTGDDGVVEIAYEDETSFFIGPRTSVDVVQTRKKGNFHFARKLLLKAGKLVSKIKRATGRDERLNIHTPSAVAGARGTQFRVSVDREEITRSEVLQGRVDVSAMKKAVLLDEGEGTLVKKGESPLAPLRLLFPPLPLEMPAVYKTEPLRLRFTTVAGAASYRVVLARDQEGKDVVVERIVGPAEEFKAIGISDGSYFLITESIDKLGLQGKPSEPLPVTVRLNPFPPHIQAPTDGAELQDGVAFRWLSVGDADGYRLQIATDREFSRIHTDVKVHGKPEHTVKGLDSGSYFFRIASVAADGYEGGWSDALGFRVVPPPPVPALATPDADAAVVHIRVHDAGKGISYRFQVARDIEFSDLLFDEPSDRPELTIPRPEEPGVYFVRAKCIDVRKYEGAFSPPQSFTIERKFPYGVLGVIGIIGLILGLVL